MLKPGPLSALAALSLLGLAGCGAVTSSGETTVVPLIAETTSGAAQLALACGGCHGSEAGPIASLNGYSAELMEQSLLAYKLEAEGTTVMQRLARGYSEADIKLISAYLSREDAP